MSEAEPSPFRTERPTYLYRYSPAGKSLDFLEGWILKGELWLSSRADFNDPYDCLPVMSLPHGELARRTALKQSRERVRGQGGSSEAEAQADALLKELRKAPRRIVEDYFALQFESLADQIGIRCFAESKDNVLMWSHYGDFHRGVCVQLNTARWPASTGHILGRVRYLNERAQIGVPGTAAFRTQLEHALVRKAEGWAYEREWRMLVHKRAKSIVPMPIELVDAIYLGARSSPETLAKAREWKKARPDLTLFQMKLCDQSFALKVVALS